MTPPEKEESRPPARSGNPTHERTARIPQSIAETLARRLLLEALQDSSALWWRRRAATFQAVGTEQSDLIAEACRARARFIEMYADEDLDDNSALLDDVLREAVA